LTPVTATFIPPGTVIAHLYVTDMVTEVSSKKTDAAPSIDVSLFDFGDSPIPAEYEDGLRQKLYEKCNVFSTAEMGRGLSQESGTSYMAD